MPRQAAISVRLLEWTGLFRPLMELRRRWRNWRRPKSLGERGEEAAARYLRRKRYIIVARSHRDDLGEIDLVAVDGRTVVFVEVKTRETHLAGHPAESVDVRKQRRLTRLAAAFLKRNDLLENRARFDVVAVTWPKAARLPTIEHIVNAFEPVGERQLFI